MSAATIRCAESPSAPAVAALPSFQASSAASATVGDAPDTAVVVGIKRTSDRLSCSHPVTDALAVTEASEGRSKDGVGLAWIQSPGKP